MISTCRYRFLSLCCR